MATFADLPSDIFMSIARFQRPVNGVASVWKHSLCLLSICRLWRAAMLPDIYATVFIAIPEDYVYSPQSETRRLPSRYITPYTNAGLIYDNGYGYLVKRMFFFSLSTCKIPFSWLYIAEALGIDENEYPEILAIRKWMDMDMSTEYQVASQNSAWVDTFDPVVHVLALRFPSISRLRINTSGYSKIQTDVISKFVSEYAQQLVKVDLVNFNVNPAFLKATNIRYFDNTVYYDFLNTSCINPHSLVCLKLHNVTSSDVWKQFVCDDDTNYIEFTSLESLQLSRNSSVNSMAPSSKSWHLTFPNLTHLKIDRGMLTNKEFQLMSLNLKTLDYSGSAESAVKLFENNIVSLERLHMNLTVYIEEEQDIEWVIPQTNKIFSILGPIPEVSLIGVQIHIFCMSNVYWPNLTQLELTTSLELHEFLHSIECMPHLQRLRLIVINSPYGTDDIDEYGADAGNYSDEEYYYGEQYTDSSWYPEVALPRLSDLKKSEQSRSKLATLTIHWFTRDAYARYVESTASKPIVDKDPGLKKFFERQHKSQPMSLHSSDSDYEYNSNSDGDSMHCVGRPNHEEPVEDAEADAALKVYFPNLVATKFAFIM